MSAIINQSPNLINIQSSQTVKAALISTNTSVSANTVQTVSNVSPAYNVTISNNATNLQTSNTVSQVPAVSAEAPAFKNQSEVMSYFRDKYKEFDFAVISHQSAVNYQVHTSAISAKDSNKDSLVGIDQDVVDKYLKMNKADFAKSEEGVMSKIKTIKQVVSTNRENIGFSAIISTFNILGSEKEIDCECSTSEKISSAKNNNTCNVDTTTADGKTANDGGFVRVNSKTTSKEENEVMDFLKNRYKDIDFSLVSHQTIMDTVKNGQVMLGESTKSKTNGVVIDQQVMDSFKKMSKSDLTKVMDKYVVDLRMYSYRLRKDSTVGAIHNVVQTMTYGLNQSKTNVKPFKRIEFDPNDQYRFSNRMISVSFHPSPDDIVPEHGDNGDKDGHEKNDNHDKEKQDNNVHIDDKSKTHDVENNNRYTPIVNNWSNNINNNSNVDQTNNTTNSKIHNAEQVDLQNRVHNLNDAKELMNNNLKSKQLYQPSEKETRISRMLTSFFGNVDIFGTYPTKSNNATINGNSQQNYSVSISRNAIFKLSNMSGEQRNSFISNLFTTINKKTETNNEHTLFIIKSSTKSKNSIYFTEHSSKIEDEKEINHNKNNGFNKHKENEMGAIHNS